MRWGRGMHGSLSLNVTIALAGGPPAESVSVALRLYRVPLSSGCASSPRQAKDSQESRDGPKAESSPTHVLTGIGKKAKSKEQRSVRSKGSASPPARRFRVAGQASASRPCMV